MAAMLEAVVHSDYAEPVLVVLNASISREAPQRSWLVRTIAEHRTLLYKVYWLIEERLYKVHPDALEFKNVETLFAGVPRLQIEPRQTAFSDYVSEEDLDAIRSYRTDVLIRLGFRILRGKIFQIPRFGVWSYHHGDTAVNRGGPPAFWETIEKSQTVGCVLQRLTEDLDQGIVLTQSHGPAYSPSVNWNRNYLFWKSTGFIPRQLRELHRIGGTRFFRRHRPKARRLAFYCNRLYRIPTNAEAFRCISKMLYRHIRYRIIQRLFKEQWILLTHVGKKPSTMLLKFQKLVPPKDRFWADPHLVQRGDAHYIFFEEFDYAKRRGHIAAAKLDGQGRITESRIILEAPYHLSYPSTFEHDGELYMIPESGANRTVDLYRCKDFPYQWEFVMHLMEGVSAYDTTLFRYLNRWWLFAAVQEREGCSPWDELCLFYASNMFSGKWTPHPLNPVVSDIRSARPAGRLFWEDGSWIRPAQDCSRRYGYRIVFNRITLLNTKEYEEKTVGAITPGWDKRIRNIHTFNRQDGLTVIDGMTCKFRWFYRIKKNIKAV